MARKKFSAKIGGAQRDDDSLSQKRIVANARAIMEESGVESVSMRRVAAALGVTAMALYHHVGDKQALVALVADQVIDEVSDSRTPDDCPWYDRLRHGFLTVHEAITRYPGLGLYIAGSNGFYPSGFRMFRETVEMLVEAGFDESEAIEINYVLLAYQGGYFLIDQSAQRPPVRVDPDQDDDRLSHLHSSAALNSLDAFARGLEGIIAGFRAQLESKGSPASRPKNANVGVLF